MAAIIAGGYRPVACLPQPSDLLLRLNAAGCTVYNDFGSEMDPKSAYHSSIVRHLTLALRVPAPEVLTSKGRASVVAGGVCPSLAHRRGSKTSGSRSPSPGPRKHPPCSDDLWYQHLRLRLTCAQFIATTRFTSFLFSASPFLNFQRSYVSFTAYCLSHPERLLSSTALALAFQRGDHLVKVAAFAGVLGLVVMVLALAACLRLLLASAATAATKGGKVHRNLSLDLATYILCLTQGSSFGDARPLGVTALFLEPPISAALRCAAGRKKIFEPVRSIVMTNTAIERASTSTLGVLIVASSSSVDTQTHRQTSRQKDRGVGVDVDDGVVVVGVGDGVYLCGCFCGGGPREPQRVDLC